MEPAEIARTKLPDWAKHVRDPALNPLTVEPDGQTLRRRNGTVQAAPCDAAQTNRGASARSAAEPNGHVTESINVHCPDCAQRRSQTHMSRTATRVRFVPKADICGSTFKPLFLRPGFRFQGLKPVCIQHAPRQFLIDTRANLFMKCTEQRLVLIRTLWRARRRQITLCVGEFLSVGAER